MSKTFVGCISRSGTYRSVCEPDADGRCLFCDCTPQEARRKLKEKQLQDVEKQRQYVDRAHRKTMTRKRNRLLEELVDEESK